MKVKLLFVILITSLLLLNCGEKEIKEINLANPIFKASGHNPDWKLEIAENGGIHFYSHSEFGKIVTPNSEEIKIMDVAATSYQAENIKVEIFRKQCIDSKDSRESKYEVIIHVKKSVDKEFKRLKGCGEFIADKRLDGKWELIKFNGVELNSADFSRGLPFIQLDINKLRIVGNSGCNNFNGEFSFVARDILVDKNMISTRMACPSMDFELEFLKALTGSSLIYSLDGDILKLMRGKREFEFRRVNLK
jgi:heat shock protein HslJ